MSDAPTPEPEPKQPAPDDPSRNDVLALGIGCLVTLIVFGAALFLGFSRG